MSLGMSYKPNLNTHMPGASLNPAGSVHSPSTSMASSTQYRQLINDYGPPSLGYTQPQLDPGVGTGNAAWQQGENATSRNGPLLPDQPEKPAIPRRLSFQGADLTMSCTDWDNLALPGQAFLPQEETLARTKERVLLKKQRNQKECLERSLEQEKTGEAKKQSQEDEREEKRKDGEVTMRSRENVKERVKEQRRVREATRKQRREKKKTTKALHINVSALVKPWEEEDKEYRKEEVEGSGSSQVPQSKYAELLAIIEELGKEIRPTYAGSKSAMERLKRGIIHARGLVRECLAETERNARS